MDEQHRTEVRTATYLAAQQRNDLRGPLATRTGKTRGVQCNPPNVRCGGRCIPPTWDCRLQGKGTNSELAAHSQDLLGGVASLQRGSRDLVKGLRTANPELINRGRNSLVRGAVKIAPGDSLQEKKRLKQAIQRNSRPIITALTLGVIGYAAHNGLKRSWPGYARGAGRQLDEAVGHAYNSVLDRTPFLGARRAAARTAGGAAISQGAQQLLRGSDLARRTSEMASTNPLRPGLAATLGIGADIRGSNLINDYDALVRSSKGTTNKDTWLQRSRELVYGATDQRGRSIYSTDASAYLLTKQFRLDPRGILGERNRSSLTTAGRRARLQSGLATRLNDLSTAMQRDMAARGLSTEDYMRRVVRTQIQATTAGVRNGRVAANQEAEDFLGRLLTANGRPAHLSHARELIGKTETHFNTVFGDLARNINRNAASADSPADEATLGFARFLASHSRGPATRVVNTEHANLYLEGVFQRRVNGSQQPIEVSIPAAIRIAKAVGGHAVDPTPERALEILRLQGGITARFASTAPSGARPQQSLTAIARRIMQSQGLSYEAALRQARNEVARRGRRDAAEPGTIRTATYLAARADAAGEQRLGKPCGASHIPKAHECRKGSAKTADKTSDKQETYNLRKWAAVGVSALAVGGIAAIIYDNTSARRKIFAELKLEQSAQRAKRAEEHAAIYDYVSSSYGMNRGLRNGWDLDERSTIIKEGLDSWLGNAPTTKGIFYRGIGFEVKSEWSNAQPGDSITDKAFGSFSADRKIGQKYGRGSDNQAGTIIVARGEANPLPYHIKGRFGGSIGESLRKEQEYLTPRNTKYKVLKVQEVTRRFTRKRGVDELVPDPNGEFTRKQRIVYVDIERP